VAAVAEDLGRAWSRGARAELRAYVHEPIVPVGGSSTGARFVRFFETSLRRADRAPRSSARSSQRKSRGKSAPRLHRSSSDPWDREQTQVDMTSGIRIAAFVLGSCSLALLAGAGCSAETADSPDATTAVDASSGNESVGASDDALWAARGYR